MPGWDEASVDELLAEPIVRDLMAADRVDPGELRALLYGIQPQWTKNDRRLHPRVVERRPEL